MKSEYRSCIPQKLLNNANSIDRDVWHRLDELIPYLHRDGVTWDERCAIPLYIFDRLYSYLTVSNNASEHEIINSELTLFNLYAWRKNKQVLRFDDSLVEMLLLKSDADQIIPCEILLTSMPYNAFFIEADMPEYNTISLESMKHAYGFWVAFDTVKDIPLALRITFENDNGPFSVLVPITQKVSINTCIDKGIESFIDQMRLNERRKVFIDKKIGLIKRMVADAMQLILYLCNSNCDIKENPQQARIYQKKSTITDKWREVRLWDVGLVDGTRFKKAEIEYLALGETQVSDSGVIGERQRPRPHMRRGHWHYYWVGSHKSGINRRLILKWIAPTYINLPNNDIDNLPTRVVSIDNT